MGSLPIPASKQMFTPDPFTKIVCIREPDGTCIRETIRVHKADIQYDRIAFSERGEQEKQEGFEVKIEGGLEELKDKVKGIEFVAPELGPIAVSMLEAFNRKE